MAHAWRASANDSASAREWIRAVALDANALAWRRCVDVLAVANINANMVRAVTPEDEIPWLQIVKGDWRRFRLLRIRRAGD